MCANAHTLSRIVFFSRETTLSKCLPPTVPSTTSSEKESTVKGKNLLPLEANSFLSGKTPFQNGSDAQRKKQKATKVVSFVTMMKKYTKDVVSPLNIPLLNKLRCYAHF